MQRFSTQFSALVILFASVLFVGCSAHVDGPSAPAGLPGGAPPPGKGTGFADQKPTIAGPNLVGHWMSACNTAPNGMDFRIFDVTFTESTVVRDTVTFSDSHCLNQTASAVKSGRYRFIDKYADGGYGIEYAFDLGKDVTAFPQEKIMLVNGTLFLADYAVGEAAVVLRGEPLTLVGNAPAPSPTPTPSPAPPTPTVPGQVQKPAQLATTYAEATFAFCSIQGSGVMLDLTGANLSADGTGTARIGFKSCGNGAPVQWNAALNHFTVKNVNGLPQIDFTDSAISDNPDYIHPFGSQSGLSPHLSANASFSGNSGECFFLTNDGTQGIPFGFTCD